ncbi:carbonic anhydrase [Suillus subalutaceus]|uniref:carbonic anhydrase n=1 Tax=Suillus subalutaceus TaxID=48586 RepID=UPI001B8730B2|nr:carbonic anhydrase [Suillus subalutaceus]KAG1869464.1 carbonic anhydrase [Suillus subalutaceus]
MSHESIQTLLNANEEWAQSVIKNTPNFFSQSATGQSPKVLWIGCSDSRVPESVITSSKPGDIFVHRNIANQFHLNDDSALSVLIYAVKVVGVEHVVLVGHTYCGGAAACLQAAKDAAADTGAPLIARVQSLDLSACSENEALNKVVETNIIMQVDNICKSEPITTAWADPNVKKVTVHGWMYDLSRGRID